MIKYCGCKTGSNLVKVSGNIKIAGVYSNPPAVQFQDDLYGRGNRVHTPLKSNTGAKYRCTVCGKES